MTSGKVFPIRFTKVDELTRPDHVWLDEADRCFFLGEYTAGQGFQYSTTNSRILNFKKGLDKRGRPEWKYKERAIEQLAAAFRGALGASPPNCVFVPVPPSKARNHPLYDDRMTRMLRAIWPDGPTDVRELLVQKGSTDPVHGSQDRPGPDEIQARYRIDESLTTPAPESIAIVDDVLATGAHFRAASTVLQARFPEASVAGLFIARRVPEPDEA